MLVSKHVNTHDLTRILNDPEVAVGKAKAQPDLFNDTCLFILKKRVGGSMCTHFLSHSGSSVAMETCRSPNPALWLYDLVLSPSFSQSLSFFFKICIA